MYKAIIIFFSLIISLNAYAENKFDYMYSRMLSNTNNPDTINFIHILQTNSELSQHMNAYEKISLINNIINININYVDDKQLWNVIDYWATPYESLSLMAGDCEDFVILKYFILKSIGIPDENLRMTYTIIKDTNEKHFILMYYDTPLSEPLVLGNRMNVIKPLSERVELEIIYSFNQENYWIIVELPRP